MERVTMTISREAQTLSESSLALRRSLGDPFLIAVSANTLGLAAMRARDLDSAESAFEECLELARHLGEDTLTATALCALGEIALERDMLDLAAERLLDALTRYRELGNERDCAECLHALGGVSAARANVRDAARLWGAADALRERSGAGLTPEEKATDERFLRVASGELGLDELSRLRTEGRALDLTQVHALASELGSVVQTE